MNLQSLDFFEKLVEVTARELPLERTGGLLVMLLKSKEAMGDFSGGFKVVGCEDLSLNHREIDFYLVQPTGMDRRVKRNNVRPLGHEPAVAALAPMGGAVVHDPEHAASRTIGFLGHDLGDQTLEGRNASGVLTSSEDSGAPNIPGCQVGKGAAPGIGMFDAHGVARPRREARMFPAAGLDAGLFVGRHHAIGIAEGASLPDAFIEIQDGAGLLGKVGISGENPTSVKPRPNRIL